VARRISNSEYSRLKDEGDTRILTKKRAEVAPTKPAPTVAQQTAGHSTELMDAIIDTNQQLIEAIKGINISAGDRPLIKTVHIGNIERNGQNRIESADMNVEYGDE